MRLFRNTFFWEWSTTADALAVRNEVNRVFGGKSRLALQNHQRPGGPCEKMGSRNNGAGLGVVVGAIILSFTSKK
jgi:hypothetical protein